MLCLLETLTGRSAVGSGIHLRDEVSRSSIVDLP
jgi:hypothetical protein